MRLVAVGKVVALNAKLSGEAQVEGPVWVKLALFGERNSARTLLAFAGMAQNDDGTPAPRKELDILVPAEEATRMCVGDELKILAVVVEPDPPPLGPHQRHCPNCGETVAV